MPTVTQAHATLGNAVNHRSLTVSHTPIASGSVANASNADDSVLPANLQHLHLIAQLDQIAEALAAHNISEADLLAEIPQARADVMVESYSAEFLARLDAAWRALHPHELSE